jgi:hypothetical protein
MLRGLKGFELSTVLYPAVDEAVVEAKFSADLQDAISKKDEVFNKGEKDNLVNSNKRESNKLELKDFTGEQLQEHPFVAGLVDKVAGYTESEKTWADEKIALETKLRETEATVETYKEAERVRQEAIHLELVNTLLAKRKEAGLPEKTIEDYKDFSDEALEEMTSIVTVKDQRAKGYVDLTGDGVDREKIKKEFLEKIGW